MTGLSHSTPVFQHSEKNSSFEKGSLQLIHLPIAYVLINKYFVIVGGHSQSVVALQYATTLENVLLDVFAEVEANNSYHIRYAAQVARKFSIQVLKAHRTSDTMSL